MSWHHVALLCGGWMCLASGFGKPLPWLACNIVWAGLSGARGGPHPGASLLMPPYILSGYGGVATRVCYNGMSMEMTKQSDLTTTWLSDLAAT